MTIPRDLSNLAPGANTSGVLQPTKGGTGATTLTGYVKGSGTSAFTASSTVPTSDLTGTLGVANGGTGLTTATAANNAIYSTSASALTAGTLPVAAGGTGVTTLTANNVLLGNGTGAVQFVAPSTNGNVLTSNGTTWVSQAASGGAQGFVLQYNGIDAAPSAITPNNSFALI